MQTYYPTDQFHTQKIPVYLANDNLYLVSIPFVIQLPFKNNDTIRFLKICMCRLLSCDMSI